LCEGQCQYCISSSASLSSCWGASEARHRRRAQATTALLTCFGTVHGSCRGGKQAAQTVDRPCTQPSSLPAVAPAGSWDEFHYVTVAVWPGDCAPYGKLRKKQALAAFIHRVAVKRQCRFGSQLRSRILPATTQRFRSAPRATTWGAVDARRRGAVSNRLIADAAAWLRPKRLSSGTRQPARAPRGSYQRPSACYSWRVPAPAGGATRWRVPLPVDRCRDWSGALLAGRAPRASPPSLCHGCP